MRRRKHEGAYIVSGPGEKERRVLSVAVGLSVAQDWACRRMKDEGVFTYKISDVLGTTVYATVTKEENGEVLTVPKI